jgi:hypothetical protein
MGIAFFVKDFFKGLFAGGDGKKPTPLQILGVSKASSIVYCQTSIYL